MTTQNSLSVESTGQRIVFAGTGGQGVITAARLLTNFFAERGNEVVSGQLHGMAQRGGAVQASVMVDCGLSPVIPAGAANAVVGFEPVETARALPFMSQKTTVFMNTKPVVPFVLAQAAVRGKSGSYPDQQILCKQIASASSSLFAFDASEIAQKAGLARTLNIVMVGCLLGFGILPADPQEFADTVLKTAPSGLADVNEEAFRLGVQKGEMLSKSREVH